MGLMDVGEEREPRLSYEPRSRLAQPFFDPWTAWGSRRERFALSNEALKMTGRSERLGDLHESTAHRQVEGLILEKAWTRNQCERLEKTHETS
jgi:hypothetical protein